MMTMANGKRVKQDGGLAWVSWSLLTGDEEHAKEYTKSHAMGHAEAMPRHMLGLPTICTLYIY